jgi:hypothetical protein
LIVPGFARIAVVAEALGDHVFERLLEGQRTE